MTDSKLLYQNRWVSLYETEDKYVYSHETRSNGRNVAILIVDSDKRMILGRYERCPAHFDGIALTSFTGGVEKGNTLATVIAEIKEEAGYEAKLRELKYLGCVRPSKSADTSVDLFAWDAAGLKAGAIEGDGSAGEIGAYTKFVSRDEAIMCKDPLMAAMIVRYEKLYGRLE